MLEPGIFPDQSGTRLRHNGWLKQLVVNRWYRLRFHLYQVAVVLTH
jgi:hypothetical protein